MKKSFFSLSRWLIILLIASIAINSTGCKAYRERKKAEQEAKLQAEEKKKKDAELKVKIEQTKKELEALLNDNTKSIEEKERLLNEIKSRGYSDTETNQLIAKLEAQINEAKAKNSVKKTEKELSAEESMKQAFVKIAGASSADEANQVISNALKLCTSEDAPVLILISQSGGIKDYDKPTTVKKYLNYVKDQKKFIEKVDKITLDANGKIKRIELHK